MPGNEQPVMHYLRAAAYIVVVAWGIRAASDVIVLLLLSLFIAYIIVPFPRWLIRRFKLRTATAIAMTVTLVPIIYVVISSLLYVTGLRMEARLPTYEVRFAAIYQQVTLFLNAHGGHFASLPSKGFLSSDRITEFAINNISTEVNLLSERLLVWLLSFLFVAEIVEQDESKRTVFAAGLIHYGGDIQRYIGIQAKTGAIAALANFALLAALGVDFPFLWCVLYFFLQFIPSLGFIIALVPPTLVALLILGWKKALLVGGGLVLTQLLADYILQPMFMKKGLHVTLLEITLSLIVWGSLLGPLGGILAIPLTLALREFIQAPLKKGAPIRAPNPAL